MKRRNEVEEAALGLGCMFALGVAWLGFIGWCLYTIVTWMVNR